MSDDIRNVDLLVKIMAMTTSDNDNIVLTAIRRANSMLSKEGKSWDDVLRGLIKITVVEDPFKNMSVPQRPQAQPNPYAAHPQYRRAASPPPPPPRPDPAEILRQQREVERQRRMQEAAHQDALRRNADRRAAERRQQEADLKAAAAARQHGERPNRYEGTCVHCANKVSVGDGIAFHNGTMWKTKHKLGQCPAPQPGRKRKGAFSVDDLAI